MQSHIHIYIWFHLILISLIDLYVFQLAPIGNLSILTAQHYPPIIILIIILIMILIIILIIIIIILIIIIIIIRIIIIIIIIIIHLVIQIILKLKTLIAR